MLAPAPGDVARANAAQANVPGRQDVHPIQPGATGQCAQLRQQRTRAADQRTRAACSAQLSQRRAAGMRCAAGQVTERRADCAADSAHNWSTRSAPMVDLSARTQVGAQSQQVPDFPGFTQRPAHHGVDVVRDRTVATTGRPVRHSRPPRRAPGPACGPGDAKPDRSRGGRGRPELVRDASARSRGRSTTEPHNRYTAAQASGSRVPSMAARATSVRRRLLLRA
jgi:hypothetical protein